MNLIKLYGFSRFFPFCDFSFFSLLFVLVLIKRIIKKWGNYYILKFMVGTCISRESSHLNVSWVLKYCNWITEVLMYQQISIHFLKKCKIQNRIFKKQLNIEGQWNLIPQLLTLGSHFCFMKYASWAKLFQVHWWILYTWTLVLSCLSELLNGAFFSLCWLSLPSSQMYAQVRRSNCLHLTSLDTTIVLHLQMGTELKSPYPEHSDLYYWATLYF